MDHAINDNRIGRLPDPSNPSEATYYSGINSKRLVAWIIDIILIGILGTVLMPFTAFTAVFFLPVFFLVVGFIYRVLTLAGGSATWGMRMTGMEIRQANGGRLDLRTALLHTALYTGAVALSPLQLISVVMMLLSDQKQGLGDMILGTAPIRRSV